MVAKGRFDGKSIVLDEPLDLPVDSRVVVEVAEETPPQAQPKQSLLEWMEANAVDAPELPTDLGYQHDHYLYGTPKKPRP